MARQGIAHPREARGTGQDQHGLVIRESMQAVRHLGSSDGEVQVLFYIDLDVNEGEVLALRRTNGAGRSTLLRAVGGLGEPDTGVVRFGGQTVTYAEPYDGARLGVVEVPGGDAVFRRLSVPDNFIDR